MSLTTIADQGATEEPVEIPEGFRTFLTTPNESLLKAFNQHDMAYLNFERLTEFERATGLDNASYVFSPLTSIPLPRYLAPVGEPPRDGSYDPRRLFSHVNAKMLWHPMFWLPLEVAQLHRNEEGRVETHDEWAVRLCMILTSAGLFDEASGTWIDILGARGLDVDNPSDLAVIEAWQDGQPNELIDSIDLSDIDDVTQAAGIFTMDAIAPWLYEGYYPAVWARLASDLIDTYEHLRAPDPSVTSEEMGAATRGFLRTAIRSVGTAKDMNGQSLRGAWEQVGKNVRPGMSVQQIVAGPISQAFELLDSVALRFAEHLQGLIADHLAAAMVHDKDSAVDLDLPDLPPEDDSERTAG